MISMMMDTIVSRTLFTVYSHEESIFVITTTDSFRLVGSKATQPIIAAVLPKLPFSSTKPKMALLPPRLKLSNF